MALADWTGLTNSLDPALVVRDHTSGITPPNGGNLYVYGFHSIDNAEGAVGNYVNAVGNPNFAPLVDAGMNPTGCSIRGAIKKLPSAKSSDFTAFLIANIQGLAIEDNAYLFGFENADPARLVVRKGSAVLGIPAATIQNSLMRSQKYVNIDEWVHVRMDCILQPSGDVLIQCYENDLVNLVSAPIWTPLAGCEEFTDDVLGIHSGSLPYSGGYAGFGFQVDGVSLRAAFDFIVLERQT